MTYFIHNCGYDYIPIESASIDLGLIDPPFSIDYNGQSSVYNRKKENVLDEYTEFNLDRCQFVAAEYYRILSQFGSMAVIMGWNSLRHWDTAFQDEDFIPLGHLIWKFQFGVYTKKRPVSSHYHILLYTKDKRKWCYNKQRDYDEDVWVINKPYQRGGLKYPNKLPDELAERLILTLSNPTDRVYDSFCGSGTTVKVAERLNRVGIGSDIRNNKEFWR